MGAAEKIEVGEALKKATVSQLKAALAEASLRERIDSLSIPVPETGCWLWTAASNECGYGLIMHKGRSIGAHRASWMVHRGEIPAGGIICHKCDTPRCINPSHLFLGSTKDNIHDMIRKGRKFDNSGSRHGMSKLSEADVAAIRARSAAGERNKSIAMDYGVWPSHISYVVKKGWRNVA